MNKYRAHAVRRISFSDLKKIPHFFKWPSVKLLSRETDEALVPFLHDLGLDINKQYGYQANKHRNFDGDVVIDFSIVGNERTDAPWIESKYSTMQALIASQSDNELKSDLLRASSEGVGDRDLMAFALRTYSADKVMKSSKSVGQEDDYEQTVVMLNAMKQMIIDVRQEEEYDHD